MSIGRVTDMKEIYDRQNELEGERDDYEEEHGKDTWRAANPDDAEALDEIEKIEVEAGATILTLWRNGCDVVFVDNFGEHVMSDVQSRLSIPVDFDMRYFDEKTWIEDQKQRYTEFEFEGRVYMVYSDF